MRPGKVSETVYKRSILKGLHHRVTEIYQNPGVGIDACVHRALGGVCPVTSAITLSGIKKRIGVFALYRAINCLAAVNAVGKSVWINFLFPDWFSESDLKIAIKELDDTTAELEVGIAGIYAESVTGILKPTITISAYGEAKQGEWVTPKQIKLDMDIVMTNYTGTEGAIILAFEQEEKLLKRFTPSFVDQIQNLLKEISAIREAKIAGMCGVKAMHTIGEGGVFGALWEVAEAAELGLEVEVRKIPIRQETIEICEFFRINPYLIPSTGSLLMLTENGHELVEELKRKGCCATVIGRTTKGKERLLFHGEERRYLEPPKINELQKGLTEELVGGEI